MRLRTAMLAGATIMTAIGGAAPAGAEMPAWLTRDFLAGYYADILADDAALRAQTENLYGPVPDAIWAVMSRHVRAAIERPGYIDYVFAQSVAWATPTTTEADLIGLGVAIDQAAAIAGVLRLPQKKQEAFMRVGRDVILWTRDNRPEACPDIVFGDDLVDAARQEFAFLITREPAYLDAYYTVLYEALAAEVDDYPYVRRLEGELDDVAPLGDYGAAVQAMIDAAPNGPQILNAIGNGTANDPALFCDFGVITIDALWTLPPDARGKVVLGLLQEAVNGTRLTPD